MSKNIGKQLHSMAKKLASLQREMTALLDLDGDKINTYEMDQIIDSRDGVMSALEALGGIVDTSDLVNAFGELIQK